MTRDGCPLEPGSLVWGYARDSGGDSQELSVPQQVAAIRRHCDRQKLVLVFVFQDKAKPGGSTAGRDAFDDMMSMARQEPAPVQGVIVWSLSRIARNVLDANAAGNPLAHRSEDAGQDDRQPDRSPGQADLSRNLRT